MRFGFGLRSALLPIITRRLKVLIVIIDFLTCRVEYELFYSSGISFRNDSLLMRLAGNHSCLVTGFRQLGRELKQSD